MAWFESRKTKEKKSRFRQLVDMALADGELDPAEQDLLEAVAEGLSIPVEEYQKILSHPERISFTPPFELEERLMQFAEIVDMMKADEKIRPEEQQFAIKMAGKLGIPPAKAPQAIQLIMDGIDQRLQWDDLVAQLQTHLKQPS